MSAKNTQQQIVAGRIKIPPVTSLIQRQLKTIIIVFNILWTVLFVGAYSWVVVTDNNEIIKLAEKEAKASHDKDEMYRRWAASQGGVYVGISDATAPNPFLKNIPERDITTPSGRKLTLINPAYMTRQVHELSGEQYEIKGHITSLNPIRPENKPDEWEKYALKEFARGKENVTTVIEVDGKPYLRYMEKFIAERSCLKCHALQGYKEGDVRGGISTSVPLSQYYQLNSKHLTIYSIVLFSIWFVGILLFNFGALMLRKQIIRNEQVEKELLRSEERFEFAEKGSSNGLWDWPDIGQDEKWWSEQWYNLLGYEKGEIKASFTNFKVLLHPEDLPRVEAALKSHFDGKAGFDIKFRLKTKPGSYKWFRGKGQASGNNEGKPVRMSGSIEDVSELIEAKEAVTEGKERFQALFNEAPISYQSLDEDGFLLEVNQTWLDILGYAKDEVIGKSFGDFFPPDKRSVFQENFSLFKASGEISGINLELVKKDGTFKLFSLDGRISKKYDGSFQQTHCVLHDITEKVKAEKALEIASKEWSAAMDSTHDAIYLLDLERNLIRANNAFYQMTETTPEMVQGRPIAEIIHADKVECTDCEICNAQADLKDAVFIIEADNPNNRFGIPWEISVSIVRDEQGKPISVLMQRRDLTRQREIENELKMHRDQLEKLVQLRTQELQNTHNQLLHAEKLAAIGKLSASIAHEFNNPLQGVMNILQGVSKRVRFEQEDAELMSLAIKESERMRDLIKNLQNFNRPTSGKISSININVIVENILLLCKKDFKTKNITVKTRYDESLQEIKGVSDQIQQVLLNLLNNASDACRENDCIEIETRALKKKIIIQIHDTGVGIAPKNIGKIFEPFFTTKPDVKGTGLGLSVSYGIIKSHNGDIQVDSELGKGTTFSIILPVNGENNAEQENHVG